MDATLYGLHAREVDRGSVLKIGNVLMWFGSFCVVWVVAGDGVDKIAEEGTVVGVQ